MPNLHELIGHLTMYYMYNVHTCALLHVTWLFFFIFYQVYNTSLNSAFLATTYKPLCIYDTIYNDN